MATETKPTASNDTHPILFDIRAAAQRLSVSTVTIRKLVRQQRLAKIPKIRKVLIPETSLQQFAQTAQ